MKKIHIFYMHHNISGKGNKNRPEWFDYEKCFKNLLASINNNKDVYLNVVMDGKIQDNWISKYKDKYKSYEIEGGSIESVTIGLYTTIKNFTCDENDLIYILENDYLHTYDWITKIQTLYKENEQGLSYVALYDHKDKYFHPMYQTLWSKIWVTANNHWRSTPSTCGSYIATKKIIDQDYDVHIGRTIPVGDHHKWLYLSKNKQRFLITPIPGLSTHCMLGLESPTIDWKEIINDINNNSHI